MVQSSPGLRMRRSFPLLLLLPTSVEVYDMDGFNYGRGTLTHRVLSQHHFFYVLLREACFWRISSSDALTKVKTDLACPPKKKRHGRWRFGTDAPTLARGSVLFTVHFGKHSCTRTLCQLRCFLVYLQKEQKRRNWNSHKMHVSTVSPQTSLMSGSILQTIR